MLSQASESAMSGLCGTSRRVVCFTWAWHGHNSLLSGALTRYLYMFGLYRPWIDALGMSFAVGLGGTAAKRAACVRVQHGGSVPQPRRWDLCCKRGAEVGIARLSTPGVAALAQGARRLAEHAADLQA